MLSQKSIDIIKSTVPVLEVTGVEITTEFYKTLFEAHPELLNIFNQANQKQGRQQTALANTVYAAAQNIENLKSIVPVVERIAHKHRSLGVKPEHYPIVGEYLLKAIKTVLKEDATDEILQAWEEAYGIIANVFISVESEMYDEAKSQKNGWEGFKDFTITKKVKESSLITSFYFQPNDQSNVPSYLPGQYITIRLLMQGQEYTQIRHYSLSSAYTPGGYRISVKREGENNPNGQMSTYLHDKLNVGDSVELTVPAGDFYCDVEESTPIALISGGVGVTPMYSMLESITEKNPSRPVTFVHAARNKEVHAFSKDVMQNISRLENGKSYIVYEQDSSECDFNGYLNSDILGEVIDQDSVCYVCGPPPFMAGVIQALVEIGIQQERIHYEFFGAALALEKNSKVSTN